MVGEPLDHSGVRHWTDQLARTRFGVQLVAGKKISSATVKAVGNRLSTYADYSTGSRVRPGIARLAVDLEMDYHTVRRAVAVLRNVGMLRLVKAGGRSGDADEYRLVIPADLLDREDIEVWSPAQQTIAIERIRLGRQRTTKGRSLIPQGSVQEAVEPVDNPISLIPGGSVQPPEPESCTDPPGSTDPRCTDPPGNFVLIPQGSATTHGPTTKEISQPVDDVRTAVTVSRANPAEQEPIPTGRGKCRRPGCGNGWVVVDGQFARCACNPRAAERPDPPPMPPNGRPPGVTIPPLITIGAGDTCPPGDPPDEPRTPRLRVVQGGQAA